MHVYILKFMKLYELKFIDKVRSPTAVRSSPTYIVKVKRVDFR